MQDRVGINVPRSLDLLPTHPYPPLEAGTDEAWSQGLGGQWTRRPSAYFPIGVILGLVGIGLGIAGRRRVQRGEATNGRQAVTGLVLSVLGLLVAAAGGFLFGSIVKEATEKCSDPELSRAEERQCLDEELD